MRRIFAIALVALCLATPTAVPAQEQGEGLMDMLARATELNEAEQRSRLVEFVEELPQPLPGKIRRIELRQAEAERVRGGAEDVGGG